MTTTTSKLNDGITDNGRIILDSLYSETGYPWHDNYKYWTPYCAVDMNACDIRKVFSTYPQDGCYLRFAIRYAEILGHAVPNEAYTRLDAMRKNTNSTS